MSNKEIIEKVREDISKIMGRELYLGCDARDIYGKYEAMNAILSHPNIAIIDPDAELPAYELPDVKLSKSEWWSGYASGHIEGKEDMFKAGWRKVVEENETN